MNLKSLFPQEGGAVMKLVRDAMSLS